MLNLTNKTMFERVAETVLYLADQVYKADDFDVDLSRQDIADLCSLSKESVIRIMKDMKEQNVLNIDRNHFEILDKNKLISISKSIY
jgi:CRP-like cAMP-binding protein